MLYNKIDEWMNDIQENEMNKINELGDYNEEIEVELKASLENFKETGAY